MSTDVTIKDIARLAGVSVSTVSRVVNRSGLVAPNKRLAVEHVLSQVNYIPNNAARALVKRRSMTIGLIVPTLSNPIFAPSIGAVETVLAEHGFGLLISCSHRDPEAELAQSRTMIERGVEGIIFTGSYRHPGVMPMIAARGIAAVSQDDPEGAPGLLSIGMPDAAAMACAIDELVARGHRRIGIVTGPTRNTRPIADRLSGGLARLAEHGIALGDAGVTEASDYSAEAARLATRKLIQQSQDLTAIACTGDMPAIGVVAECMAQGIRVPDDISITGCGETIMAQYVHPSLATVRLPFAELGRLAAQGLLDMIEGRPAAPVAPLDYAFVPGNSIRSV
ncbi:LacI family transcriptional regulator [Puniceibacterium sp. HSS470]|uniref:substrate-binding domain-containing protein n=1 Tax=Pseudooceanicola sediminis TaxID=2211117 RepID=UPI0011C35CD2|nr:substrate-binding domain-containing protein [Pseudooceanicola sediminis]KAA2313914.1 LacI family transcriptional regulator [Puniceibacterium sp. HSS470]